MKEHSVNKYNNFIGGWYISEDICDVVLDDFKNRSAEYIVKPSPRNYTGLDLFLLEDSTIHYFLNNLQNCLNSYIETYKYANDCNKFQLTEANVQLFKENNYYEVYHHENNGDKDSVNRHLVFMTYLNTINSGGHTEFFYQNLKIKPEKGLTLIWPCQWTHTHRGTHTSEKKYISTGWFNFVD